MDCGEVDKDDAVEDDRYFYFSWEVGFEGAVYGPLEEVVMVCLGCFVWVRCHFLESCFDCRFQLGFELSSVVSVIAGEQWSSDRSETCRYGSNKPCDGYNGVGERDCILNEVWISAEWFTHEDAIGSASNDIEKSKKGIELLPIDRILAPFVVDSKRQFVYDVCSKVT